MPVLLWGTGSGGLFSVGLTVLKANSDAAKLQHSFRSLGGSVFGIPETILKARLGVPTVARKIDR
jgi:hypothetical protein